MTARRSNRPKITRQSKRRLGALRSMTLLRSILHPIQGFGLVRVYGSVIPRCLIQAVIGATLDALLV